MSENNNTSVCNSSKIADFFVTEYYSRLKKDPSTLYELYHDSGHLTWVGNHMDILMEDLANPQSVIRADTKETIRSAINLLDLKNCTTYVEVLECSKSISNSLCITAKGRMYIGEGEGIGKTFVQNFLLTEIRPRWYFIRNDCLLFLDSELPLVKNSQSSKVINNESTISKNKKIHDSNLTENLHNLKDQNFGNKIINSEIAKGEDLDKLNIKEKPDERCDRNDLKNSIETSEIISDDLQTKHIGMKNKNDIFSEYNNSSDLNNNAINTTILPKYEVTSYAGKLMGGALKNGNKIKGYAIPASNDDKTKSPQQNLSKRGGNHKDNKSMRDAKNKRKIFVHSLPSNVSDYQIREAVQNQLKIHGGGYIVDIERAKVTGKHWCILELDSELSCKTLLTNGLYLGGTEIPIEKWKQMQSSTSNTNKYSNKNISNRSNAQNPGSNMRR